MLTVIIGVAALIAALFGIINSIRKRYRKLSGNSYKCSYCEVDSTHNEFIKYYCEPSDLTPKLIIRPNIRYIVTHEFDMYNLADTELNDEHILPKLIHNKSHPIKFNMQIFKQIGLSYLFNINSTSMFKLTTEYLPYPTVAQIYRRIMSTTNSEPQNYTLISNITIQYLIPYPPFPPAPPSPR